MDMQDTNRMELFEREMDAPPVSQEEGLAVLRRLGLELSPQEEDEEVAWGYWPALEAAGMGTWDEDTGRWTPTSRQFFSFDAEGTGLEEMYTHYFEGLQSITADPELTFRLLDLYTSRVNWEEQEGTVTIRFLMNGLLCDYEARFCGDWLDMGIQRAVNEGLAKFGVEKRFYGIDASQGRTMFFCTEDWARAFEEATLCFMEYGGN